MISELRDDDLPQAFTHIAIYHSYEEQIAGIEDGIAAGDRAKFLTLANAYKPVYRTWDRSPTPH